MVQSTWSRGSRAAHQGHSATRLPEPVRQVAWLSGISLLAFLTPFLFSSLLDLQHDLYYLLYFAITLGALSLYVKVNGVDVVAAAARNWKLSLGVGLAAGAFVVWSVLARLDSTPHPGGLYFAFEVAWRGVLYGIVDALLLSAFPGMVVWQAMGGQVAGPGRKLMYSASTLLLVMVITAVYHLGYEDLRTSEGIRNPEIGNTVISLPVIVSTNPVGSIVAHTSMHLAAVTHAYESEDRLPPQVSAD